MATPDVTAAEARERFNYDPDSGLFTWAKDAGAWGRIKAGSMAGSVTVHGAIVLGIGKKTYYAHRVAFLIQTGSWPSGDVDHINGNSLDNAWANLRDVPHWLNAQNRCRPTANKKSGMPMGVSIDRRDGAIRADITVNGKAYSLGRHATPEEAHAAYLEAKRRLHAGCTI